MKNHLVLTLAALSLAVTGAYAQHGGGPHNPPTTFTAVVHGMGTLDTTGSHTEFGLNFGQTATAVLGNARVASFTGTGTSATHTIIELNHATSLTLNGSTATVVGTGKMNGADVDVTLIATDTRNQAHPTGAPDTLSVTATPATGAATTISGNVNHGDIEIFIPTPPPPPPTVHEASGIGSIEESSTVHDFFKVFGRSVTPAPTSGGLNGNLRFSQMTASTTSPHPTQTIVIEANHITSMTTGTNSAGKATATLVFNGAHTHGVGTGNTADVTVTLVQDGANSTFAIDASQGGTSVFSASGTVHHGSVHIH